MEENKNSNCWKWLLLGLLALGLLFLYAAFYGKNNAKALAKSASETAQEALDTNHYGFASAKVDGANLVITGAAVDQATKIAACDAAKKALVAKGMLGLPGIVASVRCDISAPGDAPKPVAVAETKAPDSSQNCQADLNAAAATGKVLFAKSGSSIQSGQEVLDKVSEVAKKCAKFKIEVAGHTDTGGDETMNLNLSQRRAEAVRKYLIAKGVIADQLSAKGYGETKPLVQDNAVIGVDNPERQKNRRTEFNITAQ